MITINAWFDKNAKKPLFLLGIIVLSIQASFIYHRLVSHEVEKTQRVTNLVNKIANTAIEQNNRDLIEATFMVAVEELGAKYILLCKQGEVFVSFPYDAALGKCKSSFVPSFFERKIEMGASGYSDYKFIFYIPKWDLSSTFWWVILLTSASILFFFFIIFRVQRKLQTDIFRPLENELFSREQMKIAELDNLKIKINKIHKTEREQAIIAAKRESEAKFIHNIQSPLGNIKILKERLKSQLDVDSAKLFENVVSEISEITLNYTSKSASSAIAEPVSASELNSLVELHSAIEDSVGAKNLELSSREHRPQLLFINRFKQTYVEASLVELRSILSNILNNAVDSGATSITVELSSDGNTARIRVVDNGMGVNEAVKDTLFEKDVTFGKKEGTGYGLYHAKTFIHKWGGSIRLEETSAAGSTFCIFIPIRKFPVIRIGEHNQIVILEDKRSEREKLKQKIAASLSGISIKPIIEFDRSDSALKWFEKTDVSIADIILFADNDLGEDQLTGIELVQALGIGSLSHLVTNSYGSGEVMDRCRRAGVNIVPKDFIHEMNIVAN